MANIFGTAGSDFLFGTPQDDLINGLQSADTMFGGAGNDRYIVDNVGDVTNEGAGQGIDTVDSSVSYTLAGNVENLRLMGSAAINGSGNSGNNTLHGNSAANALAGGDGADTLDGKGGADWLVGGDHNDTYYIDHPGDVITESLGQGYDTVFASLSHTLAPNVERLFLTGLAFEGIGNGLGNSIIGNSEGNWLWGLDGSDTLSGGAGYDSLIGGTGADTMSGGTDSDDYYVDNAGDVVTELAGEGDWDTVYADVSYTLSANVENLTLRGTVVSGTGNDQHNSLAGNDVDNVLIGGDGWDMLDGNGGNDTLIGGTGSDVYFVDDVGDTVTELVGEGIDQVQSPFSYTLGANVEQLALTGDAAIDGTGNSLDNYLSGNDADNVLTGGDGADTFFGDGGTNILIGGAGNDIYHVEDAGDIISESAGQGIDTVEAHASYTLTAGADVEILQTDYDFGTAAINLTGNASGNVVRGNNGSNVVNGGDGDDELIGLGGQDQFLFNTPLDATINVDTLSDFSLADDTIVLENTIFGVFSAGPLAAERFIVGTAALEANDNVFYNPATGALYYDSDGNGAAAAIQFAQLAPGLALTQDEFLII